MDNWNLPLAIVDAVPVVLFFVACVELMKVFYARMSPVQYSMFASGGILVFLAGMMKVVWKFLYVMKICDYTLLSDSFFPVQSAGFILLALGMSSFVKKKKKKKAQADYDTLSAVPVVMTKMPFIMMTFLGTTLFYGSLTALGIKRKNKMIVLFFIGAYAFDMIQVAMATKFDDASPLMHWLAEMVNTLAQLSLWLGAKRMRSEYEEEHYGY